MTDLVRAIIFGFWIGEGIFDYSRKKYGQSALCFATAAVLLYMAICRLIIK